MLNETFFVLQGAANDLMMGTDALSSRCLEWLCFRIAATTVMGKALMLIAKWPNDTCYLCIWKAGKPGRRWQTEML